MKKILILLSLATFSLSTKPSGATHYSTTIPKKAKLLSGIDHLITLSDQYLYQPILMPYVHRIKTSGVGKRELSLFGASLLAYWWGPWVIHAIRSKDPVGAFWEESAKSLASAAASKNGMYFYNRATAHLKKETRLNPMDDHELTALEKSATGAQKEFLNKPFEDLQNAILYGPPGTGKTTLIRARAAKNKHEKVIEFPVEIFNLFQEWRAGKVSQVNLMKSIEKAISQLTARIKEHCNKDPKNRVIVFIEEADSIKISELATGTTRFQVKEAFQKQKDAKYQTFAPEDISTLIINGVETIINNAPKDSLLQKRGREIREILREAAKKASEGDLLDDFIKQPSNVSYENIKNQARRLKNIQIYADLILYSKKLGSKPNYIEEELIPKINDSIGKIEANIKLNDKEALFNYLRNIDKLIKGFCDPKKKWFLTTEIWRNIYAESTGKRIDNTINYLGSSITLPQKAWSVFDSFVTFLNTGSAEEATEQIQKKPIERFEEVIVGLILGWRLLFKTQNINLSKSAALSLATSQNNAKTSREKSRRINSALEGNPIPFFKTLAYICQKSGSLSEILPPHWLFQAPLLLPQTLYWLIFYELPKNLTSEIMAKTRFIMTTNDLFCLDPIFLNNNEFGEAFEHIKIGRPDINDIIKAMKTYPEFMEHIKNVAVSETESKPQTKEAEEALVNNKIYTLAKQLNRAHASYRKMLWALDQTKGKILPQEAIETFNNATALIRKNYETWKESKLKLNNLSMESFLTKNKIYLS